MHLFKRKLNDHPKVAIRFHPKNHPSPDKGDSAKIEYFSHPVMKTSNKERSRLKNPILCAID